MMAADLARALDPVALAADLGIELDEWQARLMRERPRRALLCCARQSGKTLVACVTAIWQAIYEPGLILILSPSLRQSGEAFRTVMQLYGRLKGVPELRQEFRRRAARRSGHARPRTTIWF